jgi:hypothetical protein
MIHFQCTDCATDLHVADSRSGTWIYCPRCNVRLTVPALVVAVAPSGRRVTQTAPPGEYLPEDDFTLEWDHEDEPGPLPDFAPAASAPLALAPAPEPPPRFEARPYRPERGCSPRRLPLLFGLPLLAALALGVAAGWLGQRFYPVLVLPLALGFALAVCLVGTNRLARNREPFLGMLAGLIAALAAVTALHGTDWWILRTALATDPALRSSFPSPAPADLSFRDYFSFVASHGITVGIGDRGGVNLGRLGTWAAWSIEGLLVLALATVAGWSKVNEPFCVGCQCWKRCRVLGTLRATASGTIAAVLAAGEAMQLAEHEPRPQGGELLLSVAVCPCCVGGNIEVKVERAAALPGERSRELLAYYSYPGAALPVLEQMFA